MTINNLIEKHISLAEKIAKIKRKTTPRTVQFEELQSAAYFGLVDAAHKYDESLCDNFESYASIRIYGAIADYLRELGWGSRKNLKNHVALEYDPIAPKQETSELFSLISKELPDNRASIVRGYYLENKSQEELGQEAGLSKARICQILGECKNQIRSFWSEERLLEEVA